MDLWVRTEYMEKAALAGTRVSTGEVACVRAAVDWRMLALILLLLATRIPLVPEYLYYFDSVNFALALEDFNPARHQPQPPGYPAFVLLARLLHLFLPSPEIALAASGLIAAVGAIWLVRILAGAMFGPGAGLLAAGILVVNPPFWFGGVTNQVRLGLALSSAAVALVCWRALERKQSRRWFLFACGAVGAVAGLRPVESVLLVPLVIFVWWTTRRGWRDLAAGVVVGLLAVTPWVAVIVHACGGWAETLELVRSYGQTQFRGTSALYGASWASARHMLWQAVVWNGMASLAWIWILPFAWPSLDGRRLAFLGCWFLPGFVFSAAVHIGDPDQALLTIPALCVVGGAMLDWSRRPGLALGWALAAGVVLFFIPPGGVARASSFRAVRSIDSRMQSVMGSIRELGEVQELALLHHGDVVTWRHLFYYFPQHRVMYLPTDTGEGCMTLFRRDLEDNQNCSTRLVPATRYVLLAPHLDPEWLGAHGWKRHGLIYWRDASPGLELELGRFRLRN